MDDGGAPLAQDDFGAHRHFDGLATSQRGDAPVGGADLRPVRGKQVLEPRAVGGGSQAQVRAREGQGRVGDVDSARAVVGCGRAPDSQGRVDQFALAGVEDDPQHGT